MEVTMSRYTRLFLIIVLALLLCTIGPMVTERNTCQAGNCGGTCKGYIQVGGNRYDVGPVGCAATPYQCFCPLSYPIVVTQSSCH
jgi:hypothetical protein